MTKATPDEAGSMGEMLNNGKDRDGNFVHDEKARDRLMGGALWFAIRSLMPATFMWLRSIARTNRRSSKWDTGASRRRNQAVNLPFTCSSTSCVGWSLKPTVALLIEAQTRNSSALVISACRRRPLSGYS